MYSPSSDLIVPVDVKAILSLTLMFDNPDASFNLNRCPSTRTAVFLLPPVIVTGSLTATPKMISVFSSVYFLTVDFPISEFSDNVTTSSVTILSPLYVYQGVSPVGVVTVVSVIVPSSKRNVVTSFLSSSKTIESVMVLVLHSS